MAFLKGGILAVTFSTLSLGAFAQEDRSTTVETTRGEKTVSCERLAGADPDALETYTGLASAFHNVDTDPFLNQEIRADVINVAAQRARGFAKGKRADIFEDLARKQLADKFEGFDNASDKRRHIVEVLEDQHGVLNLDGAIGECSRS